MEISLSRQEMSTKLRDPISAITHFFGAVAALIGLISLLLISEPSLGWRVSLIVYGVSLILLFSASTVYHAVQASPAVIQRLRKVDHSAIYLLIAGTYTPFCVNAFSGFWQWRFLAIIWFFAMIGIVIKLFFIRAPRWLNAGVYVVMGWLSVFAVGEMMVALSPVTMLWLVLGGVIYTTGAVVYITKRLDFIPGWIGFHEVWHIFVILGAAAHFMAVFSMMTQ